MESENKNNTSSCCTCGGNLIPFQKGVHDTRFGVDGIYDIYQCQECSLVQNPYDLSSEELKETYEQYYNYGGSKKGLYVTLRRAFLESALYRLWMAIDGDICFHSYKGTGRLIDIGCNEGQGLEIYSKNGFSVEGLELNEVAAESARKKGFTVHTGDLSTFNPENKYDVAVLSHLIEHSENPDRFINDLSRILKPAGQVWITCPNIGSWLRSVFGRFWINWHPPFHITFFSAETITRLLNKSGFEILKIKNITPALWISQSVIAYLFSRKGKKTYAHRSPFLLGGLMLIARFICFPALWIGNIMGRGDCLVVTAKLKGSEGNK